MDGEGCPALGTDLPLPPAADRRRLLFVLRMVRTADRPDAIGEAWLAWLSGEDPVKAVDRFRLRESRNRQRFATGIEVDATAPVFASARRRAPRRRRADPK